MAFRGLKTPLERSRESHSTLSTSILHVSRTPLIALPLLFHLSADLLSHQRPEREGRHDREAQEARGQLGADGLRQREGENAATAVLCCDRVCVL